MRVANMHAKAEGKPVRETPVSHEQMQEEKQRMIMQMISSEMQKVEKFAKFQSLNELQKFKQQLMNEREKVTTKEIYEEFLKVQKKNFTSNFNTTTRATHFQSKSVKAIGPCMGHYQPKKELVMKSMPNVIFHKEHLTAKTQKEKLKSNKSNLELQGISQSPIKKQPLCQHLIKSLNEITFVDKFCNRSRSPQRFK
jgi:hypothetical protein